MGPVAGEAHDDSVVIERNRVYNRGDGVARDRRNDVVLTRRAPVRTDITTVFTVGISISHVIIGGVP